MGTFAIGQIIALPFPFSDLSNSKIRPAMLLASAGKGDWIACQITSKPYADDEAVTIEDSDFQAGNLQRISYARPGKLFTAHESLFRNTAGNLSQEKTDEIREAVVKLLRK